MNIINTLNSFSDSNRAKNLAKFFQTHAGGYGEGDKFIGLTVPIVRNIVNSNYETTSLEEIEELLHSEIHEHRLCALLFLVKRFQKISIEKEIIVDIYIRNLKYINNWDLVDTSAMYIMGSFLENKDRSILYDWAKSKDLWTQRIAILSTFHFIRKNDFSTTIEISKQLLNHPHHLIHKAIGWMLREIGKRDKQVEIDFLDSHYLEMPKIMLSYSLEKFSDEEKIKYRIKK